MTQTLGPGAAAIRDELARLADPVDAVNLARFFQTGPGQYGEGDVFLGVRVPVVRAVVRAHRDLPLDEIDTLLDSPEHELRLAALLILVAQAKRATSVRRGDRVRAGELAEFYLRAVDRGRVNNWDLVDCSAEYVLGAHLLREGAAIPEYLIRSPSLWSRRVAVLTTFAFIKSGDPVPTIRLARRLLNDPEDLIQKAIGWMLREVGKRCERSTLIEFLNAHVASMSSVALSYATEHLDAETRARYRSIRRDRNSTRAWPTANPQRRS